MSKNFRNATLVFWLAIKNPRNLDGKLLEATTRSPVDDACVKISVSFDKEKVLIFTDNSDLKMGKDFVLPPKSSIVMVLANRSINNPEKIRVLDAQHNVFLDLNTMVKDCK